MEIDFQVSVGYDNRDMSKVIGQVAAPAFLLGGGRSIRLGAERAIDPRHRSLTNIKCDQRRRCHQSAPQSRYSAHEASCCTFEYFGFILSTTRNRHFFAGNRRLSKCRSTIPHDHGVAIIFYHLGRLFIVSQVYLASEVRIAIHEFDHHG